jgi:hypothetical protein
MCIKQGKSAAVYMCVRCSKVSPNTHIHGLSLSWLVALNTHIHDRSLSWLVTPNTHIHDRSLFLAC